MQIIISKNQKIMLFIFSFFMGSLFLALIIFSIGKAARTKPSQLPTNTNPNNASSNAGNGQTRSYTPEQGILPQDVQTTTQNLLVTKTTTLITNISAGSEEYKNDVFFQTTKPEVFYSISNTIAPLGSPVSTQIKRTMINSDERSGEVYVSATNNTKTLNLEFTYAKDAQDRWSLVKFANIEPVKIDRSPSP